MEAVFDKEPLNVETDDNLDCKEENDFREVSVLIIEPPRISLISICMNNNFHILQ